MPTLNAATQGTEPVLPSGNWIKTTETEKTKKVYKLGYKGPGVLNNYDEDRRDVGD